MSREPSRFSYSTVYHSPALRPTAMVTVTSALESRGVAWPWARTDYFEAVGLESSETPFSGCSDYGPFIAVGIPAGGLFTGAEGVETAAEAAVYGGTAGESCDECYHLFGDGFSSVDQTGLDEMSDAIAHAVLVYSRRDFAKAPLLDPAQAVTASLSGGEGGGLHEEQELDAS